LSIPAVPVKLSSPAVPIKELIGKPPPFARRGRVQPSAPLSENSKALHPVPALQKIQGSRYAGQRSERMQGPAQKAALQMHELAPNRQNRIN
jgi:hypothetical protein